MLQVTCQSRVLVAAEPVDFRKGIDRLAALCRTALEADPYSGALFVFRNRSRTALRVLAYDGTGFWLCHKRLSRGRFRFWPTAAGDAVMRLQAHQLAVLLSGGDAAAARGAPLWRAVAGTA